MLKRRQNPDVLGYTYRIYAPSGKHKTFRIIKLFKNGAAESIESEALNIVNQGLTSGRLNVGEARDHLEKIRENLYHADGVKTFAIVFNSDNRKILNDYWEAEYRPRLVNLEDPDTALAELKRSVDAVGAVSLRSGSRNELQTALDERLEGNLHRRAAAKINQILKFLNRGFKLVQAKEEQIEVKYLTFNECEKLFDSIPNEKIKLLHIAAFATGMRIGELMATESRLYNRSLNTIKVISQIDKKGVKRKTKNGKPRTAYVLPEFKAELERWLEIAPTFNHELRLRMSRYTKSYVARLFPSKDFTFHDMRHCYAIHLLSDGVPLSHVAQCLGDSVPVAEKYYIGFDLSADAISMINSIVKPRRQ
jgi:integrase